MLQVVERRVRRLTTLAPRWLLTIRDVHDIEQVVKCRRGRRKKGSWEEEVMYLGRKERIRKKGRDQRLNKAVSDPANNNK